jgi:hypothetical protein
MKSRQGLLLAVFALAPGSAMAAVPDVFREYLTYGNFEVGASAFERLALLMSDPSFNTYALIAMLSAALIWGGSGFFNMLRTGQLSHWLQGIVIILAGALVFVCFIMPKSDLLIHDEPSNRTMVVSEVPDGLILLAGLQNQFVQGAVNMIWTSSDPQSYRQNARGDIFNILQNAFQNSSFVPSTDDSSGKNVGLSIRRYFDDCVLFELSRPQSDLNANDFFANTSIMDVLAESVNPSVFTVRYDLAHPAGVSCSCTEAYAGIQQDLNQMAEDSGTNAKFWQERCEKAGYYDSEGATGDPASRVCRNKAVDFLAMYFAPQTSLNLMQQQLVSQEIFQYIKLNQPELLADFKIMAAARGEASASLKWLPIIKGAIFSIYIGFTPFLFMLLPTLVFPRVVQFIVGIFIFMVSWEICDAILHSYAMDMSLAAFREIFDNGLSLKSLWMMEGESAHALMIFGKMRWASMVIASTLSVVLARFGGLALSHVAGMINVGGAGAGASTEILDPEQRSAKLDRLPHAMPTEAVTNEHSWFALQGQDYYGQKSRILGNTRIIEGHGGAGPAAEAAGRMAENEFLSREARSKAIDDVGGSGKGGMLDDIENIRLRDSRASTGAIADAARDNGLSVDDMRYKQHRSDVERGYGRAAADSLDWLLTGDTTHYGSLSERAGYLKNRVLDDIKSNGEVSDWTRGKIEELNASADGRMAFLNSPAASSNLDPQEKQKLAGWLRSKGYDVGTIGSQATINFALDSSGSVVPSGITTFEGHRGTGGFNFAETTADSTDMAITPDNSVIAYQDDRPVEFIGGRLTGYKGGFYELHNGVTADGQLLNARIDPRGQFIQESHPVPLEISSSAMLNLMSNKALPQSNINVLHNKGAAVEAWTGAVGLYARSQGISNESFSKGLDGYFGIPSVGGKASMGWRKTHNEEMSENLLSNRMNKELIGAHTNQEALGIMQREYDRLIGQMSSSKKQANDLVKDLLNPEKMGKNLNSFTDTGKEN